MKCIRQFDCILLCKELNRNVIKFGRHPELCDVVLTKNSRFVNFTAYSNVHFKITRVRETLNRENYLIFCYELLLIKEFTGENEYYAMIEDLSSNGTFINGEKMG
jgi:hypothetical protein